MAKKRVEFEILADAASFQQAFERMGAAVNSLQKKFEDATKRSSNFAKAMSVVTAPIRVATQALNLFATAASRVVGSLFNLRTGIIAVVAAFAARAFARSIRDTVDHFAELAQVGRRFEETGPRIQEFRFLLDQVGVRFESMAQSFRSFDRRLDLFVTGIGGAGTESFRDLFGQMTNLATETTEAGSRTKTLTELLPLLRFQFNRMTDSAQKARIQFDIFGDSGVRLNQLLSLSDDKFALLIARFKGFGLALNETEIAKFEDFQQALKGFSETFRVVQGRFILTVADESIDFLDRSSVILGQLPKVFDRLIDTVKLGFITPTEDILQQIANAQVEGFDFSTDLTEFTTASFEAAESIKKNAIRKINEVETRALELVRVFAFEAGKIIARVLADAFITAIDLATPVIQGQLRDLISEIPGLNLLVEPTQLKNFRDELARDKKELADFSKALEQRLTEASVRAVATVRSQLDDAKKGLENLQRLAAATGPAAEIQRGGFFKRTGALELNLFPRALKLAEQDVANLTKKLEQAEAKTGDFLVRLGAVPPNLQKALSSAGKVIPVAFTDSLSLPRVTADVAKAVIDATLDAVKSLDAAFKAKVGEAERLQQEQFDAIADASAGRIEARFNATSNAVTTGMGKIAAAARDALDVLLDITGVDLSFEAAGKRLKELQDQELANLEKQFRELAATGILPPQENLEQRLGKVAQEVALLLQSSQAIGEVNRSDAEIAQLRLQRMKELEQLTDELNALVGKFPKQFEAALRSIDFDLTGIDQIQNPLDRTIALLQLVVVRWHEQTQAMEESLKVTERLRESQVDLNRQQADFAAVEARVQLSEQRGNITREQSIDQLNKLRQQLIDATRATIAHLESLEAQGETAEQVAQKIAELQKAVVDLESGQRTVRTPFEAIRGGFQDFVNEFELTLESIRELTGSVLQDSAGGLSSFFKDLARGAGDAGKAFEDLGFKLLDTVIDFITHAAVAEFFKLFAFEEAAGAIFKRGAEAAKALLDPLVKVLEGLFTFIVDGLSSLLGLGVEAGVEAAAGAAGGVASGAAQGGAAAVGGAAGQAAGAAAGEAAGDIAGASGLAGLATAISGLSGVVSTGIGTITAAIATASGAITTAIATGVTTISGLMGTMIGHLAALVGQGTAELIPVVQQHGGWIPGSRHTPEDQVSIMASGREFMMRRKATAFWDEDFLESVNRVDVGGVMRSLQGMFLPSGALQTVGVQPRRRTGGGNRFQHGGPVPAATGRRSRPEFIVVPAVVANEETLETLYAGGPNAALKFYEKHHGKLRTMDRNRGAPAI